MPQTLSIQYHELYLVNVTNSIVYLSRTAPSKYHELYRLNITNWQAPVTPPKRDSLGGVPNRGAAGVGGYGPRLIPLGEPRGTPRGTPTNRSDVVVCVCVCVCACVCACVSV